MPFVCFGRDPKSFTSNLTAIFQMEVSMVSKPYAEYPRTHLDSHQSFEFEKNRCDNVSLGFFCPKQQKKMEKRIIHDVNCDMERDGTGKVLMLFFQCQCLLLEPFPIRPLTWFSGDVSLSVARLPE